MKHIYLRDLEYLIGVYQLVAIYVKEDDIPIYYGPWFKCNLMNCEVINMTNGYDFLSFLVKYPDE